MMSQLLSFAAALFVIFGVLQCCAADCEANKKKKWYFDDSLDNGPANWGGICNTGKRQSPINIEDSKAKAIEGSDGLQLENYDKPLSKVVIKNNDHTVEVLPKDGIKRRVILNGVPYTLMAIFCTWGGQQTDEDGVTTATPGSDHTIDGEQYAMEVLLVHERDDSDDDAPVDGDDDPANNDGDKNSPNASPGNDDDPDDNTGDDNPDNDEGQADNGDAPSDNADEKDDFNYDDKKKVIISVLLDNTADTPNDAITAIQKPLKKYQYADDEFNGDLLSIDYETEIDFSDLVKTGRSFYQYNGSIPLPPCTENAMWFVLKDPRTVSNQQSLDFQTMYSEKKKDGSDGTTNDEDCHIVENYRGVQDLNDRPIASG